MGSLPIIIGIVVFIYRMYKASQEAQLKNTQKKIITPKQPTSDNNTEPSLDDILKQILEGNTPKPKTETQKTINKPIIKIEDTKLEKNIAYQNYESIETESKNLAFETKNKLDFIENNQFESIEFGNVSKRLSSIEQTSTNVDYTENIFTKKEPKKLKKFLAIDGTNFSVKDLLIAQTVFEKKF